MVFFDLLFLGWNWRGIRGVFKGKVYGFWGKRLTFSNQMQKETL